MNRSTGYTTADLAAELAQIRVLAHRLAGAEDLDALIRLAAAARYVCLGEASHGTSEYYRWRAVISRRLIEEHGFTWRLRKNPKASDQSGLSRGNGWDSGPTLQSARRAFPFFNLAHLALTKGNQSHFTTRKNSSHQHKKEDHQ